MLRTSLLAGAAMMAASTAAADIEPGFDALSRGGDATAIAEWKNRAGRGDADAQFNLAEAHKIGRGVPMDLAKAEELFGKAAAQGHRQASEAYGLLLFQRGEHARAMPYIKAAADRGDPRSQYLLGIAHFNGENAAKDWVRAYALVGLAKRGGLTQATPALAQMDKYVPLDQRQQSVALAAELARAALASRDRPPAAASRDAIVPAANSTPSASPSSRPAPPARVLASAEKAPVPAARTIGKDAPRPAATDKAEPQTFEWISMERSPPKQPVAAPQAVAKPARTTAPSPAPAPAPAFAPSSDGGWRVQLGAFGVAANADAMWNRVKSRPELAGRTRLLVPAGKVAKLQAGGFASQSEAREACSRLSADGFSCLVVRN